MGFFSLVWVNLKRNKLRTLLTSLSVIVALFLFAALRGVIDTLNDSIKVGSETRLVVQNATSLVFALPQSYRDRLAALDGVTNVTYANWFGAVWPQDRNKFFAGFAVDGATYFPMYASDLQIVEAAKPQSAVTVPPGVDSKLAGFFEDRTGCVVGQHLMKTMGWRVGQTITLASNIFTGDWPMTIKAVYHAVNPAFGEDAIVFHWKYLAEKGFGGQGLVGWYTVQLATPSQAGGVARAVDAMFENSESATRTGTERAFQAGFVSMYGNIPFLLKLLGSAIAFAILLVAANTMSMSVRERTNEIAVLKTLGFDEGAILRLIVVEAAIITLGGGLLGALLAKWLIAASGFTAMGFLPGMRVSWASIGLALGVAVAMGMASGVLPGWLIARRPIVDGLRRVE